MAGNIVKWWRQFKQYKQFSVLQECATDSEELIYQTPTACSAQPDIIINNQTSKSPSLQQHQQQQQSTTLTMMPTEITNSPPPIQQQQQQKSVKVVKVKEQQMKEKMSQEQLERLQKRHSIATTRHLEKIEENRMKLDEITCDFSVAADPSKKPQPIQFSFTLYDVDGHGKITKDDIAGIVSTIYDSLGKSVVVPHYGKKTINVKLTVSPDAKQQQQKSALNEHQNQQNRANKKHQLTPRRRYRPRALLSDDDDEDGSESNSDNLAPLPNMQTEIIHNSTKNCENNLNNNNKNNVYESINNMKSCNQTFTLDNLMTAKNNKNIEIYKNCQPSHSPERLHIDENLMTTNTAKIQPKKKILKKSRSRRPRTSETRVRSLSVGNEHKWRKAEKIPEGFVNNDSQLNNSTNIRRDELIEIIKDSMEKNRLCFQGNRKSENINSSNHIRQRSNTITCTNKMSVPNNSSNNCSDFDQQHLCAFDSFLHATICSNLHSTTISDPTKVNKVNNRHKMKQMNHSMPPALKLKTSVLNQLNPNLTPEQKLSRKLNDVEKWLLERDPTTQSEGKIRPKDDKNIHNPIVVDKLATIQASSTPKKVFNKEVLLSKKSKSKQQKDVINATKNQIILEYSSDCENLLLSEDDQTTKAQTAILNGDNKASTEIPPEAGSSDSTSKSSSVRFVHIHHHFYHFNQNECH